MPTWLVTDDDKSLAISQNGVVIKNIDKDSVVLRIIPALTGANTTTTDWLSIEHDGEYATQIPYNDVQVSGVAPSSVEDFRTKVLVILNNNSGGSYDPTPIESSWNEALARIGASLVVAGQAYKINGTDTPLPAGIDYILLWGITTTEYNSIVQAKLNNITNLVTADYDLVGNKISVVIDTIFRVTQTGTNDPVVDVTKHGINGLTFTAGYNDVGVYNISPSFPLSTLGAGLFNEVHIRQSGTVPTGGSVGSPFAFVAGFYDEQNDVCRIGSQTLDLVAGLTPTDGIYNDTPIYLTCILSN
jgi:hypothetical protein